jgi:hypothetical protein
MSSHLDVGALRAPIAAQREASQNITWFFSHVYKLRTTIPVSGFWGAIWMQTAAPEYTQILVIGS